MFWSLFVMWVKLWQMERDQKPVRRHILTCYQPAATGRTGLDRDLAEQPLSKWQSVWQTLTQKFATHTHYKTDSCKTLSHTLRNYCNNYFLSGTHDQFDRIINKRAIKLPFVVFIQVCHNVNMTVNGRLHILEILDFFCLLSTGFHLNCKFWQYFSGYDLIYLT